MLKTKRLYGEKQNWGQLAENICNCIMSYTKPVRIPIKMCSAVPFFLTPWTVARQTPLFRGFPRQEYWEWVVISSSRGSSQPRDQISVSYVSCVGRLIPYH